MDCLIDWISLSWNRSICLISGLYFKLLLSHLGSPFADKKGVRNDMNSYTYNVRSHRFICFIQGKEERCQRVLQNCDESIRIYALPQHNQQSQFCYARRMLWHLSERCAHQRHGVSSICVTPSPWNRERHSELVYITFSFVSLLNDLYKLCSTYGMMESRAFLVGKKYQPLISASNQTGLHFSSTFLSGLITSSYWGK